MTEVFIYLTPALDGVASEIGYFYANQWFKIIDAPPSVSGVINVGVPPIGITSTLHIFIPSQTIGGITYEEALSNGWYETATTFTDNITLVEVPEPPPNGNGVEPPSPIDIKSIAIPGIVGVVLVVAILRV